MIFRSKDLLHLNLDIWVLPTYGVEFFKAHLKQKNQLMRNRRSVCVVERYIINFVILVSLYISILLWCLTFTVSKENCCRRYLYVIHLLFWYHLYVKNCSAPWQILFIFVSRKQSHALVILASSCLSPRHKVMRRLVKALRPWNMMYLKYHSRTRPKRFLFFFLFRFSFPYCGEMLNFIWMDYLYMKSYLRQGRFENSTTW